MPSDVPLIASPTLNRMRALVIIPGNVSYFYDAEGMRIAEVLRNLGCVVEVHTLHTYPNQPFDWCFLLNLSEISFGYGDERGMLNHIAKLRRQCRRIAMVLLECVQMKWFHDSFYLMEKAKINLLIDLGFHNQLHNVARHVRKAYHFALNGLTESERNTYRQAQTSADERPIPWAFVGHMTPDRLDFVEQLIQRVDPTGFVYLVDFTPVTKAGPHLNEEQLHKVLQRTRYKVWCSHHPYYYIESIRFRLALMAGAVPIKVNLPTQQRDTSQPFSYLTFTFDDFDTALRDTDFDVTRQRFVSDFASLPSLESEMGALIARLS